MKRITVAKRLAIAAVACALAFAQPLAAEAAGGGFHGGGVHIGGGGFHGFGGFHGGGVRIGGFHAGVARPAGHPYYAGAHWHHGGYGYGGGWGVGLGLGLAAPYAYGAAGNWYCQDPPGYYPNVTQCYSGWQRD
jgi:hypothetical protein